MRHCGARALSVVTSVLAIGLAATGCATTGGNAATSPPPPASTSPSTAARTSAPVQGPHGPDPACAAALKAGQTLQAHQGTDQNNESAIDQDFMNFAQALSTAAQQETHPATAKAMTALANDYSALVDSQSGAADLPDMTTVENDGTNFDKACAG